QNPLIVHIDDEKVISTLVSTWPENAARLAARFWPGPLTLVVHKSACVPDAVTAGGDTVALRMPAHPVAMALLKAANIPIAAPSANRSTLLSPTRAEHVLRGLDGRIDLLLDARPTPGGLESTVLDVTTDPPRLLRPGLISPAELEAIIGPIIPNEPASSGDTLRSPGMFGRHYAPRTPLECVENGWQRVQELCSTGKRIGWLTFTEDTGPIRDELIALTMPKDAAGYAAQLYAALHTLDDARLDCIVVDLPPKTEDWLAVHDRLGRASG
ncbi:MAG TPA: L-threonylcarbamoyladenylate synthase, partial [Gemmataceae bacterium]|nr:L-threonylcarbamoyladenylate synthase [Gemmataceae bacterium]